MYGLRSLKACLEVMPTYPERPALNGRGLAVLVAEALVLEGIVSVLAAATVEGFATDSNDEVVANSTFGDEAATDAGSVVEATLTVANTVV